jgi:hypothetical protein
MGTPPEAITRGREYRLFDAGAVGLAALICTPLAGTILMAVNYRRLGRTGKGVVTVILGLIASTLTILIKWNWNKPWGSLGSLALGTLFLIGTWQTAKKVQGKAIEERIARGGQLGSRSTESIMRARQPRPRRGRSADSSSRKASLGVKESMCS